MRATNLRTTEGDLESIIAQRNDLVQKRPSGDFESYFNVKEDMIYKTQIKNLPQLQM